MLHRQISSPRSWRATESGQSSSKSNRPFEAILAKNRDRRPTATDTDVAHARLCPPTTKTPSSTCRRNTFNVPHAGVDKADDGRPIKGQIRKTMQTGPPANGAGNRCKEDRDFSPVGKPFCPKRSATAAMPPTSQYHREHLGAVQMTARELTYNGNLITLQMRTATLTPTA